MQKTLIALALAAAPFLSGCSLAPVYERPAAPVAAAWPQGAAYQVEAPSIAPAAASIPWTDYFADRRLRDVIALALANNRDSRVSALNIEKARAQYGIERAALLPSVSAAGGQSASRTPHGAAADASINRQYTANLGVAYELDFFGKVRSLSESALQQYLATEEARRAQQIALVAEVAQAWLALQADREHLQMASGTLASQQTTLALSKRRFEAGATSGLDMYEAQTSVEAARSDVALYTAQVAADENTLTLLAGAPLPASLLQMEGEGAATAAASASAAVAASPSAPASAAMSAATATATPAASVAGALPVTALTAAPLQSLPSGLPSDVLLQRPDVLAAERALQSASANIGAARAAFFPSISLTASAGSASGALSGLFKAGSGAWSFMPQIKLPLFDGGVNKSNLKMAQVERDIAVARYDKAIQQAFREVADALAQRGTLDERLAAQTALVDAAQKSFRIHQARYQQGSESYLNELVSQRTLYAAQQALIAARQAQAANQVTLYKVLGGGAV